MLWQGCVPANVSVLGLTYWKYNNVIGSGYINFAASSRGVPGPHRYPSLMRLTGAKGPVAVRRALRTWPLICRVNWRPEDNGESLEIHRHDIKDSTRCTNKHQDEVCHWEYQRPIKPTGA